MMPVPAAQPPRDLRGQPRGARLKIYAARAAVGEGMGERGAYGGSRRKARGVLLRVWAGQGGLGVCLGGGGGGGRGRGIPATRRNAEGETG